MYDVRFMGRSGTNLARVFVFIFRQHFPWPARERLKASNLSCSLGLQEHEQLNWGTPSAVLARFSSTTGFRQAWGR